MKKLPTQLLIVLSSILFSTGIQAQNKPLACQDDASAGLEWEGGRWGTKNFRLKKFILVQAGDSLTLDSVAKAMRPLNPPTTFTSCKTDILLTVTCNDGLGSSLYFEPKTLQGGMSYLTGSTENKVVNRDSVYVAVFSCTPF